MCALVRAFAVRIGVENKKNLIRRIGGCRKKRSGGCICR